MHRFYGVAVIDGVPYRVMTLMREEKNSATSNGIHSKYRLTEKEKDDSAQRIDERIAELNRQKRSNLSNPMLETQPNPTQRMGTSQTITRPLARRALPLQMQR